VSTFLIEYVPNGQAATGREVVAGHIKQMPHVGMMGPMEPDRVVQTGTKELTSFLPR
jgi:hypothetical protein